MFDWLESWDWWDRFFGGSKRQPAPTRKQFFVPPVYTTISEDMAGTGPEPLYAYYSPRLKEEGHYDAEAYADARDIWEAEEASRLRRLEQMSKLMRSTDIISGETVGGGFRPLEQRPMITQTAPLDVLDPETKTMADFIRKRNNMFAYKGMV